MSRKTKTITVQWVAGVGGAKDHYMVIKTTDTTEYHRGMTMTKTEVDYLCRSNGWKVTTV